MGLPSEDGRDYLSADYGIGGIKMVEGLLTATFILSFMSLWLSLVAYYKARQVEMELEAIVVLVEEEEPPVFDFPQDYWGEADGPEEEDELAKKAKEDAKGFFS